jgi:predicted membrane protein
MCPVLIYSFWLAILLSVLGFMTSDWPLYCLSCFYLQLLISHCMVCTSWIYGFWLAIVLSVLFWFTAKQDRQYKTYHQLHSWCDQYKLSPLFYHFKLKHWFTYMYMYCFLQFIIYSLCIDRNNFHPRTMGGVLFYGVNMLINYNFQWYNFKQYFYIAFPMNKLK